MIIKEWGLLSAGRSRIVSGNLLYDGRRVYYVLPCCVAYHGHAALLAAVVDVRYGVGAHYDPRLEYASVAGYAPRVYCDPYACCRDVDDVNDP